MTPDVIPQLGKDVGLLLARLGLGLIFAAHGWQKFFTFGLGSVQESFAQMGAPAPDVSAVLAASIELVGGVAIIVGLLTPLAAALLAADMVGAFLVAHTDQGLFITPTHSGFELVLALAAGAVAIAVAGPGRMSVDHLAGVLWAGRRSGPRGAEDSSHLGGGSSQTSRKG